MNTFDLVTPQSISDAIKAQARSNTAQQGANVRFIAGGTNLVDYMKINVEKPAQIIDINSLSLDAIKATADGGLQIGVVVARVRCNVGPPHAGEVHRVDAVAPGQQRNDPLKVVQLGAHGVHQHEGRSVAGDDVPQPAAVGTGEPLARGVRPRGEIGRWCLCLDCHILTI